MHPRFTNVRKPRSTVDCFIRIRIGMLMAHSNECNPSPVPPRYIRLAVCDHMPAVCIPSEREANSSSEKLSESARALWPATFLELEEDRSRRTQLMLLCELECSVTTFSLLLKSGFTSSQMNFRKKAFFSSSFRCFSTRPKPGHAYPLDHRRHTVGTGGLAEALPQRASRQIQTGRQVGIAQKSLTL